MLMTLVAIATNLGAASAPAPQVISKCFETDGVSYTKEEIGQRGKIKSFKIEYQYRDDTAEIAHLECLSKQNEPSALLKLGRRYEDGIGVPQNLRRALDLYRRSSANTQEDRIIFLAKPRDGQEPGWVYKGSLHPLSQDSLNARYRIGLMYLEGRGVKQDTKRGTLIMEALAKLGWSADATENPSQVRER